MKKYKIFNKLLFLLFVTVGLFGCTTSSDKGGGGVQVVYHPAEEKPQIVVYSKYLPVNTAERQSYSLNASVIPEEESSSALVYSSSDSSIASVSNDGTVTVNKAGIARINIALEKDNDINNQVIVNAYNKAANEENGVAVMAVAVDTTYVKLQKGSGLAVFPSVRPGNAANKELVYLSTNDAVAEVKDGFIRGVNEGSAGIIIYSKSNPEKYAFISVDVTNSSIGAFTPPAGTAKIDLNADPMSLIAKYQILNYSINGGDAEQADEASSLRVNVNLDELGAGFVKILMYVNLNGKEVRLIQKKNIGDYGSIPDIFTSLGAKITGDWTMEFTLDPVNYTELARQGMVNKGDTLVLNIGKMEALAPAGGLGSDIDFDESTVPVEGTNTDDNLEDNSNGNTEKPEDNTPAEILVESIKFNITDFSPIMVNETIKINATVSPDNAVNKSLTWKSSNESVATVDTNGLVTVHKNGASVISATSSNGIKAEMKIVPAQTIDSYALDSDKIELTMNVDAEAYLTYKVYPEILNGEDLSAEYFSDNDNIVTVDRTGKITAVGTGETFVKVTINNISKECYIVVNPEPENVTPVSNILLPDGNEGRYELSVVQFTLKAQVMPEDAFNKRLKYQSSNPNIADVNAAGVVTLKSVGETNITITSSSNSEVKAVYKVIVETLPSNIVYEKFDYGVAVGTTEKIIPIFEGNPSNTNAVYTIDNITIARVDEKTGAVTGLSSGSATLTAKSDNGLTASTLITVYTPVRKGDAASLQGTYQIVDFNQANGHLDVGTNAYGGVERMIGEMTIEVTGNTVKIKSKIQMDSSAMNSFGGVLGQGVDEARSGQFQYTEYATAAYDQNGFGTAGQTSAKVTHDNDMLKLYQEWKEMKIATVKVNTWIKKKSDTVKDLKQNNFHFGYMDKNKTQKSNAYANKDKYYSNVNVPDKEPYYTHGLITK
ncbi:MAG: Ig-like domain-containing protein [Mucispirillum sp.]|nr:Ig-like domain-containing protein [Mucispirillum sp.]